MKIKTAANIKKNQNLARINTKFEKKKNNKVKENNTKLKITELLLENKYKDTNNITKIILNGDEQKKNNNKKRTNTSLPSDTRDAFLPSDLEENVRSNVTTIDNKINNTAITIRNSRPITVSGSNSYSSITKQGRKIFIVGYSHVRRIRGNEFNTELVHVDGFF